MSTAIFTAGNYRYLLGPPQFSAGAVAIEGFRIVRVRLAKPLPLMSGFKAAASIITQSNRPLTALCSCELRSPMPLEDAEFSSFNRAYSEILKEWGLLAEGSNPVARSNVCPATNGSSEPSLFAFSYTEAVASAAPSFVLSGCADARPGATPYAERIIRLGDTTRDGLRQKASFVHSMIKARSEELGIDLESLTAVQVYCMHGLHEVLSFETLPRAALEVGITWFKCRPPVIGLEYELDCRAVHIERQVAA